MLEALAVQQYFSGGLGHALGELLWTTRVPSYVFALEMTAVALWAGFRTAKFCRASVAVISGALVYASIMIFWILTALLADGASEAGEFLDGPYTAQAKLLFLTLAGGAVGTWLRARREYVT